MPYKDLEKRKLYLKKYRKEHPEKYVERRSSSDRYLLNPSRWIYWKIKNSAKRRGLDFNLDIEDVVVPSHCPILGIPLVVANKGSRNNSPSIDRIDNSKGYVKGNIKIISTKANTMKSDLTKETLLKLLDYVSNT